MRPVCFIKNMVTQLSGTASIKARTFDFRITQPIAPAAPVALTVVTVVIMA